MKKYWGHSTINKDMTPYANTKPFSKVDQALTNIFHC